MECNCPKCNGLGDGLPQGYVEPEEKLPKSVYEKLVALEEKLKFYSTQDANELIQIVIDLAEEVDAIDSRIITLKGAVQRFETRDNMMIELGEISKKLY